MSHGNKYEQSPICKIFVIFAFLNITKIKSQARMMMFHMNIEIIFYHSQSYHLYKILFAIYKGFCYALSSTFNTTRWQFEALTFGSSLGAHYHSTIKLH